MQAVVRGIYVDPGLVSYALQLATATRRPDEFGLPDLARFISFGASPRGPISLIHAARGLAVVRGRDYVLVQDLQELIKDALRHRWCSPTRRWPSAQRRQPARRGHRRRARCRSSTSPGSAA